MSTCRCGIISSRISTSGIGWQYNAGRYLDYADAAVPDLLADAVIAELSSTPKYRPVETDGTQRAAAMLAELL